MVAGKGNGGAERDTFHVLRESVSFRFSQRPPTGRGDVMLLNSRKSGIAFKKFRGKVALIVTSPPYLDTTDYSEDQWLRLWFLGGANRPVHRLNRDDRHTRVDEYWDFLREIWKGVSPLLRDECTIVVRIGGTRLAKLELHEGLFATLSSGLKNRNVRLHNAGRSSAITNRQTNSFRPGTKAARMEHDFTFAIN